ncbi:kinase-like protein [Roridomyces roridus]|uniref:Kinase-like protein n=1 Tax=Roridomyces roridus TaxID=1738132 RepID=A0AAD7FP86_9AGAR|nr:kinase-like protein [Roridomyces roridus]
MESNDICAKLVTVHRGRREAVIVKLNKPAKIGRNPARCDYVCEGVFVSGIHCELSAVRTAHGGVIVSCQDFSRNGIMLNGQRISKSVVILLHGDIIEFPSMEEEPRVFTCIHMWRDRPDKIDLFDPTPPQHPSNNTKTITIGKYLVSNQKLGSGAFATVHLALDTTHAARRQVACKTIRAKKGCDVTQIFKEISILNGLEHPNINRIYDTERDSQFIFIFLQLCTGGDLFTYITEKVHLNQAESKFLFFQILLGLDHLHERSISHRDLKPENILLYAPGAYPRIVIADFGLARPMAYQETRNVCGTVSYLPPEGILALDQEHLKYVGMPSDCWSSGVILYVMLTGSHPFDNDPEFGSSSNWLNHIKASRGSEPSKNYHDHEANLKAKIIAGDIDFTCKRWDALPDAKALVSSLLIHNYEQRATIRDALHSYWIRCELTGLREAYHNRVLVSARP